MAQIKDTLKGDGLVITTRDWRTLGSSTSIEVRNNFNVCSIDPSDFTGSIYISNRAIKCINLTMALDAKVYVLVGCLNKEEKLQEKEEIIKHAFADALDHAFSRLPAAGPTKMDKAAKLCHSFLDRVTGASKNCLCYNGQILEIYSEDVEMFGKHLQDRLMQTLRRQNYDCCLLIYKFGQTKEWSKFRESYAALRPQFADEMIVHVARDYEQDGKCLLWDLEKVQSYPGITGSPEVFTPLMTFGHGNLEYDRFKVSRARATFASQLASGMEYAHLKFYGNTFKEVHRGNINPSGTFKIPNVMTALTCIKQAKGFQSDRHMDDAITLPRQIIKVIKSIRDMYAEISTATSNKPRFEAIIVAPAHCLTGKTADTVWNMFPEYFETKIVGRNKGEKEWLNAFDYNAFLDQINATLLIPIQTLSPILNATFLKRKKDETVTSIPSYETIELAVVCEYIIGFAIFGTLNYFPNKEKNAGRRRHNRNLVQKLCLSTNYYERKIDENPFHGLERCGESLKATGRKLVWTDKTFLGRSMWYKLKANVNGISDEEYMQLGRIFVRTIGCRPAMFNQARLNGILGDLCKYLRIVITKHSEEVLQPPADKFIPGEEYRMVEVIKVNKSKNITLGTSKMFVEMLFYNTEDLEKVGFGHYLRDVYDELDAETKLAFRKRFALFIEDQLIKFASPAVVYPFNPNNLFLILPFAGGAQVKYAQAGDDLRRRIKILYSYLYKRHFEGAECNDRLLDAALVEASTFRGAWNFEAYVDEIGGNRVVDLMYALYRAHVCVIDDYYVRG